MKSISSVVVVIFVSAAAAVCALGSAAGFDRLANGGRAVPDNRLAQLKAGIACSGQKAMKYCDFTPSFCCYIVAGNPLCRTSMSGLSRITQVQCQHAERYGCIDGEVPYTVKGDRADLTCTATKTFIRATCNGGTCSSADDGGDTCYVEHYEPGISCGTATATAWLPDEDCT